MSIAATAQLPSVVDRHGALARCGGARARSLLSHPSGIALVPAVAVVLAVVL
jgi:hypothetical protein